MTHFWVTTYQLGISSLQYLSKMLFHPPPTLLPLFSLSFTVAALSLSAPFIYSSQLSLHCKTLQSTAVLTPSKEMWLRVPVAENTVWLSGSLGLRCGRVRFCHQHVAVALLFAQ